MTDPDDQPNLPLHEDELTLHAFGELDPEQARLVEARLKEDLAARSRVDAMRRLASLSEEASMAPAEDLLETAREQLAWAIARKRRARRRWIAATGGGLAAAAAIALAIVSWQGPPSDVLRIAEKPGAPDEGVQQTQRDRAADKTPDRRRPPAADEQPSTARTRAATLTESDRRVLRETMQRLQRRTAWDDTLSRDIRSLRRRLAAAQASDAEFWPELSPQSPATRRGVEGSQRLDGKPRTTQPAGSTRSPAAKKEANHA